MSGAERGTRYHTVRAMYPICGMSNIIGVPPAVSLGTVIYSSVCLSGDIFPCKFPPLQFLPDTTKTSAILVTAVNKDGCPALVFRIPLAAQDDALLAHNLSSPISPLQTHVIQSCRTRVAHPQIVSV